MNKYPQLYHIALVRDRPLKEIPELANAPEKVAAILRAVIQSSDREHFVIIMLDGRSRVIGVNVASVGTLSASLVHPREVFKPAILANAAAIVVGHNHPSGDYEPSADDRDATRRLVRAGRLLGIPVLDHVIVDTTEGGGHYSFRHEGLIS